MIIDISLSNTRIIFRSSEGFIEIQVSGPNGGTVKIYDIKEFTQLMKMFVGGLEK